MAPSCKNIPSSAQGHDTGMRSAALFLIVKKWKRTEVPNNTREWLNKLSHSCAVDC